MTECGHKRRYLSRKIAKGVIRRMQGRDHVGRLNAYRCTRCGLWHLGHYSPLARENARKRRDTAAQLHQGD